jgi:hypothetical protein
LVGTALTAALRDAGHDVIRLVRREPKPGSGEARWDPEAGYIAPASLEAVGVFVNLTGKNIASGRWTAATRQALYESRVDSTRLLAEAMARLPSPPRLLLSASAIGYYGDRGEAVLDEEAEPGSGFLPSLVGDWEDATKAAADAGVRVVQLRLATVLSPRGGALKTMLTPFRLGLGGPIGDGLQFWSWISIDDAIGAMLHIMDRPELRGPVNVASPSPVTNREFALALGRALRRPALVPVPRLAARMAFGRMADEVLLASTRVTPRRLTESGYHFEHPTLDEAFDALL